MQKHFAVVTCAITFLAAAAFATAPAFADKPSWAGGGNKHEREHERGHGDGGHGAERHERGGERFGDHHRVIVRNYYGEQFHTGHCPPGLAKKHNGCMPPGQARKWRVGYVLPREVAYYEVPPALVIELGRPPAGYRYVRVAADILMVAVGTGMVVDAIQDLGRM
ncbi:MAG TPA: RcnB family protein [Burkholderiales bacterium]|nr:RcnB family protein [Burkholderiales bacterium]